MHIICLFVASIKNAGKKFQLANVKDVNYRTEQTPSESENVNNNHAYKYDANGNVKKIGWNVKVDSKGNKTGYGRYVIVQHSDGYETLYAHLDKNGVAVSVGDKVSENNVIAKSGNTGGSTGPHLHIEISKGNILQKSNKIDPSSIPDLQLLLHPDNKEYYGGELSPVTVYGHAPTPTPMLLQPISLPKIEEIKINTQDKE